MRIGALLVLLAAAAGCGSGSSGNGGVLAASCACPGGTCDASGVCVLPTPSGAPLTCPAGEKPLGTSTADASQVQHLGAVQVGREVAFTVPQGTASVTILEQAVSAPDLVTLDGTRIDNTAVPLFVKDPSGRLVYDDTNIPSDPVAIANLPAFFASDSPATGTLTIPNTSGGLSSLAASGSLPAGSWRVTVSDFANECATGQGVPAGSTCTGGSNASTYDVTVLTKPSAAGGGIPASGPLDVAFYFATTTAPLPGGQNVPLSAANAAAGGDPDVNRMVQTLGQIFSSAGIALRNVTFTDVPASVQATYATGVNVDQTGACGPLAQLLKLSSPGNTLNIFFVSSFQASGLQSNNQVVGIDGTIPGPSTVGGTVASGAAVATHDLRAGRAACGGGFTISCGADVTAYIVAHEAGHFLGLYHVTESDGTAFDPLLDTATCACQSCAPPSVRSTCADSSPPPAAGTAHQMSVADCTASATCSGGENLMFWILDQGSQAALSSEQMQVMRANALVQ